MLRVLSSRFTHNSSVTKLVEEAREKGKHAPSISTNGSSIDHPSSRRVHTPIQASVSSPFASPVSSFHPAEEIDVSDPRISNGSRGGGDRGSRINPPPYMPGLEAGNVGVYMNESTGIGPSGYTKDQTFPGC